jgi:dsDNA-specific endonuclease/ATPase MutS2
MGAVNSSIMKTLNNVVNETVNESVSNITNKSDQLMDTINNFKFINKGTINCSIANQQNIKADQGAKQKTIFTSIDDLKSSMQAAFDNIAKSNQEAVSGFLSTTISTNVNKIEIINDITNKITNLDVTNL